MALRVALLMALSALLVLPAQPAKAQGFWQSLFGNNSPPTSRSAPSVKPYPATPPAMSPYQPSYSWPFWSGPLSPYQPERRNDESQQFARGGTYRTLCVRLCDGFYFPISSAATHSSLVRDADTCTASCGAEARLFYYPNVGGDVEGMVDLSGVAYAALPNAFKYRKTLVDGCRCRPQPWSEAELKRHRAYAQGHAAVAGAETPSPAGEAGSNPSDPPATHNWASGPASIDPAALDQADLARMAPSPVAGIDEAQAPSVESQRAVVRPQPVPRRVEPVQPLWPNFKAGSSAAPKSKYAWPVDSRYQN